MGDSLGAVGRDHRRHRGDGRLEVAAALDDRRNPLCHHVRRRLGVRPHAVPAAKHTTDLSAAHKDSTCNRDTSGAFERTA